jgi:prophage DNA circulation protein
LLNACEEDGAGTLIHPFHGEHEVVCETCTVSEGRSTGIRYASFELAFVEHGDYRAPDWEQDPAHTLLNQTQGGYRAAEAAF